MFLQDLENKKPIYFHRLMADLYQQVAYVPFILFLPHTTHFTSLP